MFKNIHQRRLNDYIFIQGIVVKVVAKSLGEKYYKKKGYVKELVDDYVGLIVMNDTGKFFL